MDKREEIEKVAYELYEKNNRIDGRDFENWLEAENIVNARYEKKEFSKVVKQMGQAVEAATQKVKEAVKEKVTELKAVKKPVKRTNP